MAFLTITTNDGEVIERVDLDGYDLEKPMARADLLNTISRAMTIINDRLIDEMGPNRSPDATTYSDRQLQEIIDAGVTGDAENGPHPDDVEEGVFLKLATDEKVGRVAKGVWTLPMP